MLSGHKPLARYSKREQRPVGLSIDPEAGGDGEWEQNQNTNKQQRVIPHQVIIRKHCKLRLLHPSGQGCHFNQAAGCCGSDPGLRGASISQAGLSKEWTSNLYSKNKGKTRSNVRDTFLKRNKTFFKIRRNGTVGIKRPEKVADTEIKELDWDSWGISHLGTEQLCSKCRTIVLKWKVWKSAQEDQPEKTNRIGAPQRGKHAIHEQK